MKVQGNSLLVDQVEPEDSGAVTLLSDGDLNDHKLRNVAAVHDETTGTDLLDFSNGDVRANTDLYLGGQSIVDADGEKRLEIYGSATLLRDDTGTKVLQADAGQKTFLQTNSGQPVEILDATTNNTVFRANPSGPVEVRNAQFDVNGNRITGAELIEHAGIGSYLNLNTSGNGAHGIRIHDVANSQDLLVAHEGGPVQVLNATFTAPDGGPNGNGAIGFTNTNIHENGNGEIVAVDSAGNVTTLT